MPHPVLSTQPWRRYVKAVTQQRATCALCGRPGANSGDHIVPISLGGDPYNPANWQPAHIECNKAKGNRVAQTWRNPR